MQINMTGRHFEISDSIREYLLEKAKRLERVFDGITEIEAVLKNEDRTFHCELIIHIRNKPSLVVDESQESMHAAIDVATDKAQRQLRRHKERVREHRPGDSGKMRAVKLSPRPEDVSEEKSEE